MRTIDINCDMGESFGSYTIGSDETIIAAISSANIACGFHAGDPLVMDRTVRLAKENGVGVGAHPGFPDLMGFGRRKIQTFPGEITRYLIYQIGALAAFATAHGVNLQHVKPHGALYNMAAADEAVAREVVEAVRAVNGNLILVCQPGSVLAHVAEKEGLRVAREVFPDRAYLADGRLAPRNLPGAVIHDPQAVRDRVVRLLEEGVLFSLDGEKISLEADTLCVHGDTPGAAELARIIRKELEEAGIAVEPMGWFL